MRRSAKEDYYELVEQIKRIPIRQAYDQYIGGNLQVHGKKAVSQCPWHGRDTMPSLTLYLDKGNWYCYGCQRGGTVIDLVMEALAVDFKTAVTVLARDFGLGSVQADPVVRQQRTKAREQYVLETEFAADLDRIFQELVVRQKTCSAGLRSYFDYDENPELVHERSMIDYILDEIAEAREPDEKLRAWRLARKVFPWLKA